MPVIPDKLKRGDKIMIVAPARGLKLIGADCRLVAEQNLKALGLDVVYAPHTTDENFDLLGSTSVEKRVEDLMQAFSDPSVKGVLTVIGGFNSNQLLHALDYDLIRQNPKIFMGFSDITALHAAIYAQTGLVTYYGPHYSSLGMKNGCAYTLENMEKMLFGTGRMQLKPSQEWSDDLWFLDQDKREFISNEGWWQLSEGKASGTIIGGNLCTFALNLGTSFRPKFEKTTILFLEDDEESTLVRFERHLWALMNQPDFENVKGLVIGRFQKASKVSRADLELILRPLIGQMPIIANIDMGHTTPIATIPLGGKAILDCGQIYIEG